MSDSEATTSTHRSESNSTATIHNPEESRLKALLEPAVLASRLYLEDVSIHVAGSHRTVHVVVDLPQEETGGVSLDAIAEVSRGLSDILDNDPHDDGRPYDLEVSSPGVSRPLTEPRHWHRARGRMVRVNVIQGDNLLGRIASVQEDSVTLIPEHEVKKGMKPKQGDPITIPFDRIRQGKVEIEFSHLHEAALEDEHNGPSEEA